MSHGLYRSKHGDNDVVYVTPPPTILEQWVTRDTYDGLGEPPADELPFKETPDA